jgi:hypothetical protein
VFRPPRLADTGDLVVAPRAGGAAAAAASIAVRAPLVVTIVAAALVTAGVRAVG